MSTGNCEKYGRLIQTSWTLSSGYFQWIKIISPEVLGTEQCNTILLPSTGWYAFDALMYGVAILVIKAVILKKKKTICLIISFYTYYINWYNFNNIIQYIINL